MNTASPGSKLPSLTGLRFIAALFVFLYHTSLLLELPDSGPISPFADDNWGNSFASALTNGGYVGVSFFFVLSGFVLTWSTRPGEPMTAFLRRRVLKIFPTHLVTWAIAMALFAAAVTPASTWLLNLFLLHSYVPDGATFQSVNGPSWSLSVELLFYVAVFPLAIYLVRRASGSALWAWAGVMVAGMVGVVLLSEALAPSFADVPVFQYWLTNYFPVSRVFEFVLGMLLARIVLTGRFPRIGVAPAAVLMAAGYAGSLYVPYLYRTSVATVLPIAVLICAAASADVRGRATAFGGRAMRWLGERSFGFYMAQGIVLFHGRRVLGDFAQYSTPVAILVVLAFLAANIVAGWLLYVCVERPVMRRWSRRKPPPEPVVEPAAVSAAA